MVKKMDSYRYLYRLLKNREYEKALKYTKNHIENNTDDERIYICFIMLEICIDEINNGINNIFSNLEIKTDFSDICEHYTNVKFYVRRFEYELKETLLQEAVDYFQHMHVSGIAIFCIVQYACVDKLKASKKIREFLLKKGLDNIAKDIREYS